MYKELNRIFKYDPETGILTNKINRGKRAKAGDEAGTLHVTGYRRVCIKGKRIKIEGETDLLGNQRYRLIGTRSKMYPVHRIIWMMIHGYFPEHGLDHINGIRDDNRLCNLREASTACNMQNQKLRCNNISGYRGVSWSRGTSKWQAYATLQGKTTYLGLHETKEEARDARIAWEENEPGWTCNHRKEGR